MNKLKFAVITFLCTFPVFVGMSTPTLAADYRLEGTLAPSTSKYILGDFTSFLGTFTLPDDRKVDTYNGRISTGEYYSTVANFNIDYYDNQGFTRYNEGPGSDTAVWLNASESVNSSGNRTLFFSDHHSHLLLTFAPNISAPSGLSFKSGEFGYIRAIAAPDSNGGISLVTNATITSVSVPEPSTIVVLLLPSIALLLRRRKKNFDNVMKNS